MDRREYMREIMRNRRRQVMLIVNNEERLISYSEMLKVNKIMLKVNKTDMENLLKVNEFVLKVNTEMLKVNKAKNAKIEPKTPFLPENAPVSGSSRAQNGEGGLGGGGEINLSNTNTVTVTQHNVTSSLYGKKEENVATDVTVTPEKENLLKVNKNKKMLKVNKNGLHNFSDELLSVHKAYPRKDGKIPGLLKLQQYEKYGILPEIEFLLAAIDIQSDRWHFEGRERDKIPHFATWVNQMRWSDLPEDKINAHIARRKALAAQSTQMPAKAAEASKTPLKMQIPADFRLPGKKEWEGMTGLQKMQWVGESGLGEMNPSIDIPNIIAEVGRRIAE